jgi:hypothetical protein
VTALEDTAEQDALASKANVRALQGLRPLRRPTPAETERIARACPLTH